MRPGGRVVGCCRLFGLRDGWVFAQTIERRLVFTQPNPSWLAHRPVPRPVREDALADEFGGDPARILRARNAFRLRRFDSVRVEASGQVATRLGVEPRPDAPRVRQLPLFGHGESERPHVVLGSRHGDVTDDGAVLPVVEAELPPRGPSAGRVRRPFLLRDKPF